MDKMLIYTVRFISLLSSIYSMFLYAFFCLLDRVSTDEDLENLIDDQRLFEKTPVELQHWIRNYFTYRSDLIDYSKHPLMFLKDRVGDCDDFASFCELLLPKLGYSNVYIVTVMNSKCSGHAVCIAQKNGVVYGFSNWHILFLPNHDLYHLGYMISEKINKGKLWFIIKYIDGKYIESLVNHES